MIREYKESDAPYLSKIGDLIKEDFFKVYDINNFINYDYGRVYIYEIDHRIVGFIQIEIHFEVIDIINIAVDKEYQNQGIATKLINYTVDNFNFEALKLEVNEKNISAIKTYQKNNFIEIHRRKKYYGSDDAIIMERKKI